MSLTEFVAKLRRYDQNAKVIFDEEEPIGQPTDLVMPHKPWFKRPASSRDSGTALRRHCDQENSLPAVHSAAADKDR